jgi:N-acetylglucosaminyl-diphospho-decaprenol L-rhamnosyltransferase
MIPSLDIVIVNWNSGDLLRRCMRSLVASLPCGAQIDRVVVVDNGSADDSMRELPSTGIELIVLQNSVNRGFAAACNQGARGAAAPYLLFLNPDTRIDGDAIETAVKFLESPANSAVAACGVQNVGEDGEVQRTCAFLPRPSHFIYASLGLSRLAPRLFPDLMMRDWAHNETRRVDHVIGSFLMIRTAVFESLGGFDERYFVYLEDLDLSWRVASRGLQMYFLSSARIIHVGGGTSRQVLDRRLFYSLQSRLLFARKHFSSVASTLVMLCTAILEPFTRLADCLLKGDLRGCAYTLRGYGMLYSALPRILSIRSDA